MIKYYHSKEARHFLAKIGNSIDACDEYGETILHHFAGKKWTPPIFLDYLNLIKIGCDLEKRDVCGNTPIDEAIDCHNWDALASFIQVQLSHTCIIHAIGELLAQYWHTGSAIHDQFIFSLIKKAEKLDKNDCEYLLRRACDGAAWPYLLPLLIVAQASPRDLKKNFPWQIEENNRLCYEIISKIENSIDDFKENMNIFSMEGQCLKIKPNIIETKHHLYNKISFIKAQRKCVTRSMKKQVKKEKIKIKFLSPLIRMYCLRKGGG